MTNFEALPLILALSAIPSPDSTWQTPSESNLLDLYGVRWKQELKQFKLLATNYEEWSQPAFSADGSRVFIGTRAGRLEARAVLDGKLLWHKPKVGVIGNSMVPFGDSIVLGIDSDLVALDVVRGIERWRVRLGGSVGGPSSLWGEIGVFPVRPNAYVAVNLVSGKRLWQVKRPTPEALTIRGQGGATIDAARESAYLGFSDGRLIAVDLKQGTTQWTASLGSVGEFFADIDTQPALIDKGKGLIVGAYNSGLFRVDPATGSIEWTQKELTKVTSLTNTTEGVLIAGKGDGQVLGLNPKGDVIWRYRMKKGSPRRPMLLPNRLVAVASNRGPLALLQIGNGRPVQLLPTGSGMSAPPAVYGSDLMLMTNGGLFLATRAKAGGKILLH
ncbi:MAG: PQQ-binding-like beta-propeller repeat protein [Myxococcales bacterium]|nr:PQQ-binding-like beta-propeller repeat protein [Myxococcales bacterium]